MAFTCPPLPTSHPRKPPERCAATKQNEANNAAIVNGKAISMSDYQAEIDRLHRQISMTGRQPDEKEMQALKQRVLDNMIDPVLLEAGSSEERNQGR